MYQLLHCGMLKEAQELAVKRIFLHNDTFHNCKYVYIYLHTYHYSGISIEMHLSTITLRHDQRGSGIVC
jgi:NADPH-dependent 7-cyano-7-deazaguanine reductase QueF